MRIVFHSVIAAIGAHYLMLNFAIAEPRAPSCTLADVTSTMASDPNCSLDNAVIFGSNIIDFVTTQCAPFAVNPENSGKRAKGACMRCAHLAWAAFKTAAEAKLINAKPKRENAGQIKKLCGLNNGNDPGDDDSDSDALKNLYAELRLCFPDNGGPADAEGCAACAMDALNAALESGAISQGKFNVMKASMQAACLSAANPKATPTTVPGDGGNSFTKYGQGLRACFEKYITEEGRDTASCLSCIQAVDASGLNPVNVSRYLAYATANCSGTTVHPTPTPAGGGNSFQKFGQGLTACFHEFITENGRDAAGCISCISEVDASGLDPSSVASYLSYATAHCNGTSK